MQKNAGRVDVVGDLNRTRAGTRLAHSTGGTKAHSPKKDPGELVKGNSRLGTGKKEQMRITDRILPDKNSGHNH